MFVFFFQAEDGIRDLVRSRGLGDVYKRQVLQERLVLRVQQVLQERLVLRVQRVILAQQVLQELSLIHI